MTAGDSDDLLEKADQHWLAVGLRMGLEQPEEARRLLARIERPWQADEAPVVVPGSSTDEMADPEPGAVAAERSMPAASMLLVRSATMSADQQAELGPGVVWGWTSRLTPAEVALMGRVVQQMLDEGAPPNAGRGFGIAWTDGVKLPVAALDRMFKEFVELEYAVASVIAGHEVATSSASGQRTLGGMLAGWFGRPDSGSAEAGSIIQGAGRPTQLGLVALWNAWVGVRFRASMPQATFELLVRPWATVIGPLPEA
jgi:hypothetical protein